MFGVEESMNLDEIVATGELFKLGSQRKNWMLRKFVLSGIYMHYFDTNGQKRGQWDITECVVKKISPEECSMNAAKFAFALIGPKKYYLACASSEKNRHAWMTVLDEQIEEFKEDMRRFLRSGEIVLGNAIVRKKNMLGIGSNIRMLLTNYPRIMLIEPASLVLKDQMSWTRENPPILAKINETKFKIALSAKEYNLEDSENGTRYWEDIFKRFPNMKYFVQKAQRSLNIDFHDAVELEEDKLAQLLQAAPQKTPQEIALEEKRAANMRFLEEALRNIRDLVDALTSRIDELDEEEAAAASGGEDSEEMRKLRAHKKEQLQILKDNVSVLSSNLQSLVTRSMESGVTDFDMEAIDSVITETGMMLQILENGDDDILFGDIDEDDGSEDMDEQLYLVDQLAEGVEWMVMQDELTADAFVELDAIEDVQITEDNFDPVDSSVRPLGWKEIRLKRVLMKEYVEKLEGVPEDVIAIRRAQRMATEERLMVQEVREKGRLLNMPILRKVRTPSQRLAIEAAALAVTDDNFDPDKADRRPLAWQAVKLRRVVTKEDIYRRQGSTEEEIATMREKLLVEEERLMLEEVAATGAVTALQGAHRDTPRVKASQLVISPATFDPRDPSKRPGGWFEVRRQRVLVKEQLDRLDGVDEETIFEMRPRKEEEEEAIMVSEAMSQRRIQSVCFDASPVTGSGSGPHGEIPESSLVFAPSTWDPKDPAKRPQGWFEIRRKRVLVKEQIERMNGVSEEAISEQRPSRDLEEEAIMISEVLNSGALQGSAAARDKHKEVVITKSNYSASKRPDGWHELRLRRVMLKEHIDRIVGIDEELIAEMRSDREVAEEALMMDEVQCLGRVLEVGQTGRGLIPHVPVVVISPENYEASDPTKRPVGWAEARAKRVMIKEQVDRGRAVTDAAILANHLQKEQEALMMEEVARFGHLMGIGGPTAESDLPLRVPVIEFTKENFDPSFPSKRPEGWIAARKKRVHKKEQIERLRGTSPFAIEEGRRQREIDEEQIMLDEVAKHGHLIGIGGPARAMKSKNMLDQLDISDATFDPSSGMRPKGWAEVKLRRVYIKEWQDRKDGIDEDIIMARRFAREQEVEKEMITEASVHGRIRAIEKRIQAAKNVKPIFPKGYRQYGRSKSKAGDGPSVGNLKRRSLIKSIARPRVKSRFDKEKRRSVMKGDRSKSGMGDLSNFMSAANQTLESLSDLVAETLAEKVMGEEPGSRASRRVRQVPQAAPLQSNQPRVIAPAAPRGKPKAVVPDVATALRSTPNRPTKNLEGSEIDNLNINEKNFDVNDPRRRPPGWNELRNRRVGALEKMDRAENVPEMVITSRHEARELKEEELMIGEACELLRLHNSTSGSNSTVLPTNFRSNLTAIKGTGQVSSRSITQQILSNSGRR